MKITLTALFAIFCAIALNSCAKAPRTSIEQIAGPIEQMRKAVEKTVTESGRQGQLLSVIDELDAVLKAHSTDLEAISGDLSRLNADYDVPREIFEKVLSDFAARSKERRQRLLDLHFQLTGLTSPEEWKPISKQEVEAVGAARNYFTN
jgi:hypothetical protein